MNFPYFLLLVISSVTLAAPPLLPQSPIFEPRQDSIPNHRLSTAVYPTHYTVELQPILTPGHGQIFTAPGKVWINTVCRTMTTNITLHSLTINVTASSVRVYEFPVEIDVPISNITTDLEKEELIINLEQPLRAAQVYRIYIEFVAPISDQVLYGLYLSNYTASNGETRYMAVTDLEATDARRVFPCFDEPDLKATFDVYIIRLPEFHALANMNLLGTETTVPNLPGWVKDKFERTEKMSTYLFAVAVSDFEKEDATPGFYSKPVSVWGPPPLMQAGAGKYSPDITAKLLTALENYFDVEYTFPKMDKIGVPHFGGGAMENWGLNTYKLNRLLIEEGVATVADRVSAATTLSHELVHQWFGNLVTMKWWDDLWLNEGFASYYSNTAVQDIGLEDMLPLDTLVSDAVQRAMQYDATNATHPIHYSVETPKEIRILFDTITYSKGAALVRMMNAFLTEQIMRKGLTAYLRKFSHSNAHQDDLFQVLTEEATATALLPVDSTVKSIMDDWTLSSGFPVLHVSRTFGSPAMILRQENYRPEVDPSFPIDPTAKWNIPITFQAATDSIASTNTKVWFLKGEAVNIAPVSGSAKWVVVNPQQTGYYRVNYNEAALKDIIEQLHTNHSAFDAQTRSMLVDDNLNLAFAGYMPLGNALNLTIYLKNERHLVPWTSFVNNMAKPYKLLGRSAAATGFKKYVLSLVKDTLAEIKLDPQPAEPIGMATILRNKLFEWACNLGDKDCVNYSVGKFKDWALDPTNNSIIFPDLRPFVYCTAVANGGQAEWDFVFAQYLVADRDVTKTNLIRSLACTRSSNKLHHLLDMAISLNSGIASEHRLTVIQAVAGNSAGVDILLNFVRNNFSLINRRFGPTLVSSAITALSNSLNRPYDITDLQRFMSTHEAELAPVKGVIEGAIGNVMSNARWMQRNYNQFDKFMAGL